MNDKRDFICAICSCSYFWVKQWDPVEPGWFVLCGECKELYELLSDGTTKRLAYLTKN